MIVKQFDIGWGLNWPAKQLEQKIVRQLLHDRWHDQSRSVIVNSVWYNQDYHQQVMTELAQLQPSHVYVIAMLDPPIVKLDWFESLNCEVQGVGYYPGSRYFDYFAEFFDQFHVRIPHDQLLDHTKIDTAYMCLNRKPHVHRLRLYQGLENLMILDRGFVSMGGSPPMRLLPNDCEGQPLAPNPGSEHYGINNDVASLGNLDRWQRHFVNVVTETVWDLDTHNFVSEKTFKPVLGLRPFLLYAVNGGVDCLRSRGIETYVSDFADISDLDLTQPGSIPEFLKQLCDQPVSYYRMKYFDLKDKILHNYHAFVEHVAQQKNIL